MTLPRPLRVARHLCVAVASCLSAAAGPATRPAVPADPVTFAPLGEPGCGGAVVSVVVDPRDHDHLLSTGDMLGAAVSFDGGDRWQATFGFATDEMGTATFSTTNPAVCWTGSCGGPYRSDDRGVHWRSRRAGMPASVAGRYSAVVEKVLFDPATPGRLLAVGGSSRRWDTHPACFGWVWESADDGEHWSHVATLTPDGPIAPGAMPGRNIVWAAFRPGSAAEVDALLDGGAWMHSADGGRTWNPVHAAGVGGRIEYLTFDPTDARVVYAATSTRVDRKPVESGGVYKSADGGRTFAEADRGIAKVHVGSEWNTNSNFGNVAVSAADPTRLTVADRAWNSGIVYRSADAGGTWTPSVSRVPVGQAQPPAAAGAFRLRTPMYAGLSVQLTADPTDADRVYGFNTESVIRTRDGGRTWTDTDFNPDPARPDRWRGCGWTGWCANNVRFNPFRPTQLVVQGMDDSRAWVSDDDGQTWHYAATDAVPWLGGDGVGFGPGGQVYVTTGQFGRANGVCRSDDWGQTWRTVAGKSHGLPDAGWAAHGSMGGVVVSPADGRRAWIAVDGSILATADGGDHWTPVKRGSFVWLEPDPTRAGRFYAGGDNGVYATDDGRRFTNVGGPRRLNRGKMHVDAAGRLYAAQWRTAGTSGLWRYDPAARAWDRLLDEDQLIAVASDPADARRLAVVTSMDPFCDDDGGRGVWLSDDAGASWSRHDGGLPVVRANCVTFDPKDGQRLIVGSYGRGFWQATWPRSFHPVGTRRYVTTPADRAYAVPMPPGHVVRDFGPGGFDYTYGKTWTADAVRATATAVEIRATEFGGGGVALNGADLTPDGEPKLVLRLRTLPENRATALVVNLIGVDGVSRSVTVPLPPPSADFADVVVTLPGDGPRPLKQLQFQGTNFSPAAVPLHVVIDAVRTGE